MLAAGCDVSSAELITSTGDGDVASVRSVRRVPSTTMSFDGSGVALAASGTLSCTALAGAGAGVAPSCPLPGVAAKAADPARSATASATVEVVYLIILSPL